MTMKKTVGWCLLAVAGMARPTDAAPARRLSETATSLAAAFQEPARQPGAKIAAPANVNAEALLLQDFQKRIDAYLAVRKKAASGVPPLKVTNDPAAINRGEDGLAASIGAARADAKPGDIFTPAIRSKFRRLLAPEMKGEDGKDAREVMDDDAPASLPLKVNAKYPEGAALPTVPASILTNLPKLPEELEYRIVDKHLILRDAKANIIVDFIPNAIR